MDFEWDKAKEAANRRKHGIDFRLAAEIFRAPDLVEIPDFRNDFSEPRFRAVGSIEGLVLVVAYTYRGDRIRIISARKATPRERKSHHSL